MQTHRRIVVMLCALAWLAVPVGAGIEVDYEVGIDFESYRTYAWQPGTDAGQPQIQQAIYRYVEQELREAGLEKVSVDEADLFVVSHAFSEMNAHATGGYVYAQRWGVGILSTGVAVDTKGYLVIDLIDSQSEQAVWSARATEVMGLPDLTKLTNKVKNITRKMFKKFPPR
jgi:hypothetical protein